MPAKSITDAFCRNVKLPNKDDRPNQVAYIDTMERGLGLMLVVGYGGSRTFRALTYDVNGQPKTKKLGRYPRMKVKEARNKAREYFENPEKIEAEAETGTFRDVADAWFEDHVVGGRRRSAPEIRRHLSRYIYPKWKAHPFIEIRRREVSNLLDEIAKKNGRPQADAVLATIRGICNWYEARSESYTSPIVRAMKKDTRSPDEKQRDRILDEDEIKAVWLACNKLGDRFGAIVKLLLLTGQRRSKVVAIKWSDLDLESGRWKIATEEREKGNAGEVKLPPFALEIVKAQLQVAGNPYVFAARTRNKLNGHFDSWGESKRKLDALLPPDMPRWKIHDLRRTCRSMMARLGVLDHIAKRTTGHKLQGMDAIYNRHDYFDEKSAALTKIASFVENLVNSPPLNVVQMAQHRQRIKK